MENKSPEADIVSALWRQPRRLTGGEFLWKVEKIALATTHQTRPKAAGAPAELLSGSNGSAVGCRTDSAATQQTSLGLRRHARAPARSPSPLGSTRGAGDRSGHPLFLGSQEEKSSTAGASWLKGCWGTPAPCQGRTRIQIPTRQSPGSPRLRNPKRSHAGRSGDAVVMEP